MAKTYAGYVKREVANEIDWSSIGSGISDMLLEERDARETKKKEIDDASREFSKVLTEAEGSEHTGINQFFLDGANSIQEVRLMQDRLLRSGQLRLKDYNVQRQNAIDGTNEMLALVKGYDTKYKEKMARLEKGVSAAQEQYLMEQIEGFSNFQNHRLYVNPTNGQFSIGKTVPGKGGINELSKDPNDFSTMQALKNRLNIKIDKYDWNANVQQGVDNLAKIVLAKNADGKKTVEDARQSSEYKDAKANWIDSMMTNSTNAGSMLTDWIGGYGFTQNSFQAEGDASKILLVPDPRQPSSGNLVPKLTDAQETAVRERLEQEFESRVDRIETARQEFAPQRPTATDKEYSRTLRKNADLAKDITDVLTNPNATDVQAGLGILREYGLNIRGSAKTPTGLNFEVYNKNTKKYEDVPVIIDKQDTRGSVERVLQKLLGRDVDINEVMNQLPDDFFEGKNITEIESLFAPQEVVEIKEVDSRQNVMMDPLQEDLTQSKPVTVDSQIKKLEDGTIDEQEEVTTVLSEVLKQQGIDDVDVQFTTERTAQGRRGRQVTTVDINSKYFEQPYKVLLSEFENEIRTIIQDITNKRKSQMTFGGEPTVQGNETAPQTGNVDAFGNTIQ